MGMFCNVNRCIPHVLLNSLHNNTHFLCVCTTFLFNIDLCRLSACRSRVQFARVQSTDKANQPSDDGRHSRTITIVEFFCCRAHWSTAVRASAIEHHHDDRMQWLSRTNWRPMNPTGENGGGVRVHTHACVREREYVCTCATGLASRAIYIGVCSVCSGESETHVARATRFSVMISTSTFDPPTSSLPPSKVSDIVLAISHTSFQPYYNIIFKISVTIHKQQTLQKPCRWFVTLINQM